MRRTRRGRGMRLGLNIGYAGAKVDARLDLVLEADRLGYDSVWVAEAYGSDAVTILAWYGALTERIRLGSAIMQMPARTPAMTAMTAVTLSELSGGRFTLGLGMSGPQVVEGWHGRPYGKPLAVEIADGWLPFWYSPYRGAAVFDPALEAGFAASGDPGKRERFEVVPSVPAAVTDDLDQARWAVRPLLALYVGGMGAKGKNFYFDLVCRYGYEEAATKVQELYLQGKREEAMAELPDDLVDEVALLGTKEQL